MSDESEEVHSGGLLKRYVERPDCLKNITLADWAAWYDSCGKQNNHAFQKMHLIMISKRSPASN